MLLARNVVSEVVANCIALVFVVYDPSRTKTIVAKLGTERTHVFFDLNTQKESADKSTQDKDVQPTIGEGFEAEKITNTPLEEFGDNGVDDKANLIMLHTDGCNTMRGGKKSGISNI